MFRTSAPEFYPSAVVSEDLLHDFGGLCLPWAFVTDGTAPGRWESELVYNVPSLEAWAGHAMGSNFHSMREDVSGAGIHHP